MQAIGYQKAVHQQPSSVGSSIYTERDSRRSYHTEHSQDPAARAGRCVPYTPRAKTPVYRRGHQRSYLTMQL
jgi:hypothetical protein